MRVLSSAVPEPHKSFRVRIRNAALNRSFKNTGTRVVIIGTVSLIRKRKNILVWALILGALCFSFTNFVISRLKGKIEVRSPYLSNKIKEAGVRIKMENMIRICWKISGTQLWIEQPHLPLLAVFLIRIHRIHMFLGLPDPDPLVRGMDPDPAPDPDPSIIMQK